MENIMFETASKKKLRFDTSRGFISVEDLWELPLTSQTKLSLDEVAKTVYAEIKTESVTSFVDDEISVADDLNKLRFDIVKHVIDVKKAERDRARLDREKKEKKAKLMELIELKQNDELRNKSIDELIAMVNEI